MTKDHRIQLAKRVNERRYARGKEPLQLAHVLRAVRYVVGAPPAPVLGPKRYPYGKRLGRLDVSSGVYLSELGEAELGLYKVVAAVKALRGPRKA